VEWIQEAVVKEQALKMSDVFTFSSYWFCLFPEGLRRTQELLNTKLKTGTEDKKGSCLGEVLKEEKDCIGLLVLCKVRRKKKMVTKS